MPADNPTRMQRLGWDHPPPEPKAEEKPAEVPADDEPDPPVG